MPSLKTLLQLPCGWLSSRQVVSPGGITIHLRTTRKTALCPECLKRSRSVHSCRRRRIQHLPCAGRTLWLIFVVRHWYCRNPSCSRKIFAESLAPFAGPQQQSSALLQNLQHQLGLIAGGEAGRRAVRQPAGDDGGHPENSAGAQKQTQRPDGEGASVGDHRPHGTDVD